MMHSRDLMVAVWQTVGSVAHAESVAGDCTLHIAGRLRWVHTVIRKY